MYRDQNVLKQQYSNDLRGAIVMGPTISLDEWIPERPPKNPFLRVPSPDLPPPPPPPPSLLVKNHENYNGNQDDPLPPPPPEILKQMYQISETENKLNSANRRNSFAGQSTTRKPFIKAKNFVDSSPPILPRKPILPNSTDRYKPRPFSSMRQPHGWNILQTQQAIKTKRKEPIGNGPLDSPKINRTISVTDDSTSSQSIENRTSSNDHRISVRLRKRSHNAPLPVAATDDNSRFR